MTAFHFCSFRYPQMGSAIIHCCTAAARDCCWRLVLQEMHFEGERGAWASEGETNRWRMCKEDRRRDLRSRKLRDGKYGRRDESLHQRAW
jgi:hypothetical protein